MCPTNRIKSPFSSLTGVNFRDDPAGWLTSVAPLTVEWPSRFGSPMLSDAANRLAEANSNGAPDQRQCSPIRMVDAPRYASMEFDDAMEEWSL